MTVVLASNNAHKLAELRAMLAPLGYEVVSQKDMEIFVEPDETGETFEENSYIKAKAVYDICRLPTIADDSGLMVDALGGAPGVHSARYGGSDCRTDRDRMTLLLKNLKDVPEGQRAAKFVSVITMLLPGRTAPIVARGELHGCITRKAEGSNGFGYDPVFFVPDKNCTSASLPPQEKNRISHRARALTELIALLQKEKLNADQ